MKRLLSTTLLAHCPLPVCLISRQDLMIVYKNDKFLDFVKKIELDADNDSFSAFLAGLAPDHATNALAYLQQRKSYAIKNLTVELKRDSAVTVFMVDIDITPTTELDGDLFAVWINCEPLPTDIKSTAPSKIPKVPFAKAEYVDSYMRELRSVRPVHSITKEQMQAQYAERLYSADMTEHAYVQELSTAISNLPIGVAILSSRDMVLQMANKYMLTLWDKEENIIGQRLVDYLPEMRYQAFPNILDDVYVKQVAYHSTDAPVELVREGNKELVYMDFSYTPILDENGNTKCILVMAENVTERTLGKVRQQQLLDDFNNANERLRQANQQIQKSQQAISTLNDELTTVNGEQFATNAKLEISQSELHKTIRELKASTVRFEQLVKEASIGILVFHRRDNRIMMANGEFARIFCTATEELYNYDISKKLPDFYRTVQPILDELVDTESKKDLYNEYVSFRAGDEKEFRYLNLVVQKHYSNETENNQILVLCHDVTNQVKGRLRIHQAEAITSLSLETANMGAFHITTDDMSMSSSHRFKEIYGYESSTELTYDEMLARVLPDHRENVQKKVLDCIQQKTKYVAEYPIKRFNDEEIRWIKAYGGVFKPDGRHTSIFSGVIVDITEQKQDEQRKNDFIAMVSHELKTPLTSIHAYLQLLRKNAERINQQSCVDMSNKALAQAGKMTTMINGFLNVSRLESGKIYIEHSQFQIEELLHELTQELQSILTSHVIKLELKTRKTLFADKDKIAQVVTNLVTNAAKYSKSGTNIQIVCVCEKDDVIVSVKDQGMGISESDLDNIFKRYYRVNDRSGHPVSGFGIGLYLCYEIVNRHQGKIWAESKLGQGSKFSFSIPASARSELRPSDDE